MLRNDADIYTYTFYKACCERDSDHVNLGSDLQGTVKAIEIRH